MKDISDFTEDILSWKSKYRSIFYLKIKEELYIFRTLTRGEYLDLMTVQLGTDADISDAVLERCLLYPKFDVKEFDKKNAGEVDYLFKCINDSSGFSRTEQFIKDLEDERQNISILDNQVILLICKAFPHLTIKEIDQLDYYTLLRYIAMAEAVLGVDLKFEKQIQSNKIDFEKDNAELFGKGKGPANFSKPTRGDAS